MDAVVKVSPRGIRAGAENHTAVARPASPKSSGYGSRPMLLSSVVEVHGPARTRSPRVAAGPDRHRQQRRGQQGGGTAQRGPADRLERPGPRGGRPQQGGDVHAGQQLGRRETGLHQPGAVPDGHLGPRGRSSTGMVIRSGRRSAPGAPCVRFQSATVSAVATISWSFTVYGAPDSRRGTAEFGQQQGVAGHRPGPRRTRRDPDGTCCRRGRGPP
ncbi:hypothetical protein SCALM49S_08435 [Streptomyces californicus]